MIKTVVKYDVSLFASLQHCTDYIIHLALVRRSGKEKLFIMRIDAKNEIQHDMNVFKLAQLSFELFLYAPLTIWFVPYTPKSKHKVPKNTKALNTKDLHRPAKTNIHIYQSESILH